MSITTAHAPHGSGAPRWAGAATATPGLLAFAGQVGTAAPHAHAAVQVVLVTAGDLVLVDGNGMGQPADLAIIPAGVRHELLAAPGTWGLLAYLDAASRAGRAATMRVRATGGDPAEASTWQAAAQPVLDPGGSPVPLPFLAPAAARLDGLSPPLLPSPGGPPAALERALTLVPQLIGGPLLLEDLAARVGLSASRLGHLFAEHLQLPYPSWRRWARLLRAIDAVREGASLTTAAHTAGFADSAHLTRTCRAMFGITPSQALAATGW